MRPVRRAMVAGRVLLALCVLGVARADIDLPSVPPPQPFPAEVTLFRGESVELPLRGVSRTGRGLKFLIRQGPSLGALSEIEVSGATTASVRYTHNPKAGLGEDAIRYAVQAPGTGVSTPVEIKIHVMERPPIFVAPKRLDFPPIPVGRSATRTIELRNDGGGMIAGELRLEAPWSFVDGGGSYRLGAGESRELAIRFSPTEGRQFAATVDFSHSVEVSLGLGGRAFDPVEASPREVILDSEGASEVRTGGFIVRNLTGEERTLTIEAPKEVVVQSSVLAPAESEREVALHTVAGFLGAIEGVVRITGENTDLKLPLKVRAAPPKLEIDRRDGMDFGKLAAGHTGRLALTIRNVGGSIAELRATLPEGVSIVPEPSLEAIPPGAAMSYEVRFSRSIAGKVADAIVIHTGYAAARIPFAAVVTRAPPVAAAAGERQGAQPRASVETNDIPPVESVAVTRQTRTELDLAWKKSSPNVARYAVFMRRIGFREGGKAYAVWNEIREAKVRFVGKEARVTVGGFRPGERVAIAVIGYDAAGGQSVPSLPFLVSTKPSPAIRIPWVFAGLVAIVIFATLIFRERRRVRRAEDAEFERVSHL